MTEPTKKPKLSERIDEGIKQAIKEAIDEHKKEGRPYVISRDGKIIWVLPDTKEEKTD